MYVHIFIRPFVCLFVFTSFTHLKCILRCSCKYTNVMDFNRYNDITESIRLVINKLLCLILSDKGLGG